MTENWKDIEGYEGLYQVSDLGRVKSLRYNKIMSLSIRNGYNQVGLRKDNLIKCKQVHRLVWETFNHKTKLHIDHKIEGNKLDNRLSNLQALTARQNISKCKMYKNKSSNYTGVSWSKLHKKWASKIQIKKQTIHLGFFSNELEAFSAYQNASPK